MARPIDLGGHKKVYLIVDTLNVFTKQLVGELLTLFGRFDRDSADEHYTTLDSFARQSIQVVDSVSSRQKLVEADAISIANIASMILTSWHNLSSQQRDGIREILARLEVRLDRTRNPSLQKAASRVKATTELTDSTGRPNPLVVQTRLLAALRDLDVEKAQFELTNLASSDRLASVVALQNGVDTRISSIFAHLNEDEYDQKLLAALLDDVAIKPYSFACMQAKEMILPRSMSESTKASIKDAFDFESNMLALSNILSLLRSDIDHFQIYMPVLSAFTFGQAYRHQLKLKVEISTRLDDLDAAFLSHNIAAESKRESIERQINDIILSIKQKIRYR